MTKTALWTTLGFAYYIAEEHLAGDLELQYESGAVWHTAWSNPNSQPLAKNNPVRWSQAVADIPPQAQALRFRAAQGRGGTLAIDSIQSSYASSEKDSPARKLNNGSAQTYEVVTCGFEADTCGWTTQTQARPTEQPRPARARGC